MGRLKSEVRSQKLLSERSKVKSEELKVKSERFYIGVVVVLGCLIVSSGMIRAQMKSASEILARSEKNLEGIEDYVVDLQADLDMESLRMPRMEATMYFKKPAKIHFESPNFAMLPREGFGTPVSMLIERYDASLKGEEAVGDIRAYRLQLVAKDPATRLQQLFVWVNKANFTIAKTETVPYQGRSVKMEFGYALQEGRYWLPERLQVDLTVPQVDSVAAGQDLDVPGAPQLRRGAGRAPRKGNIVVTYSNYRINTGLSDELFTIPERERR